MLVCYVLLAIVDRSSVLRFVSRPTRPFPRLRFLHYERADPVESNPIRGIFALHFIFLLKITLAHPVTTITTYEPTAQGKSVATMLQQSTLSI
jgi:hypothetical protein